MSKEVITSHDHPTTAILEFSTSISLLLCFSFWGHFDLGLSGYGRQLGKWGRVSCECACRVCACSVWWVDGHGWSRLGFRVLGC